MIFDRLYQCSIHHLLWKTIIAIVLPLHFILCAIIDISTLASTILHKLVIEPMTRSTDFLLSLLALLRIIVLDSSLIEWLYVPSSNHYSLIIVSNKQTQWS